MTDRKRVFSGIQPTGNIHIGNYIGAGRNYVTLQEEYETIYCVVDLHAMTVPYDPKDLRAGKINVAKMLLAMGIDPERSLLYNQSDVPHHAELSWILGTITSMGQLERMTQYKEKSDKSGQNLGLFAYPVLMAADILVHRVHAVPVGEDQTQHLELTRDLAERFNHRFGELFPVPEAIVPEVGARIMSLTDPTSKMSKSDPSPRSRVHLTDTPDEIASKIRSAVTDAGAEVAYEPEQKPGISNLLEIFSAFDGRSIDELVAEYRDSGYGVFKSAVADAVIEGLRPLQEAYSALSDDEVHRVMEASAEKARDMASETMRLVREAVGLD
ncbi:MAG TPA: tryptophan--tRNA ligase [Acidimicrobiia bacterium]